MSLLDILCNTYLRLMSRFLLCIQSVLGLSKDIQILLDKLYIYILYHYKFHQDIQQAALHLHHMNGLKDIHDNHYLHLNSRNQVCKVLTHKNCLFSCIQYLKLSKSYLSDKEDI